MKIRIIVSLIAAILIVQCAGETVQDDKPAEPTDKITVDSTGSDLTDTTVIDESENSCIASLSAYVSDPDAGGPTNVRDAPNGKKVLLELIHDGEEYEEYMLDLTGCADGWFKVEGSISGIENAYSIPGGVGWIHGSVIGVDTRNYGGQELSFYADPDETSAVVATISSEKHFHLKESCGSWTKVAGTDDKGKSFTGWIQNEWLCGNPMTTCS